ncbi:nucleotide-diphospho-sugar transferase [Radiomyces spectabilis]|uniref:nucleotide-diphospho-sugar transferase n=1 Tax=Radiomyces spectabilis TaxID=64574 RepID=UPI0022205DF6|nr:nucleotide-diphospho-sugar transferase [Radiomyces spectabilis]KAI8377954.1 nucleotide-diphospho-sugar transferase [Radiomyces spectabilis]
MKSSPKDKCKLAHSIDINAHDDHIIVTPSRKYARVVKRITRFCLSPLWICGAVIFLGGCLVYNHQNRFIGATDLANQAIGLPSFLPPDYEFHWHEAIHDSPNASVKAAFVTIAQESDLYKLIASVKDIQDRFNDRHGYPWIVLSDKPHSLRFRERIRHLIKHGSVYFGHIPLSHWHEPYWVDMEAAEISMMVAINEENVYANRAHWRKKTRYSAGLIARHPLLSHLDFIWQVHPGSEYKCDILIDPFAVMHADNKKFGFGMSLFASTRDKDPLWEKVLEYIEKNRHTIRPDDLPMSEINQLQSQVGEYWGKYNGAVFFNDLLVLSLSFLRSPEYLHFFHFLDRQGGFFNEAWGGATFPPLPSLGAGLFLNRSEFYYMSEIGYTHDMINSCPYNSARHRSLRCTCIPNNFGKTSGYSVHWNVVFLSSFLFYSSS